MLAAQQATDGFPGMRVAQQGQGRPPRRGCPGRSGRGAPAACLYQPMSLPARPNILFILADDLGWADLGVYGARDIRTPHLDRLAAGGVRFTQAYASSAVCSVTRVALMTGRYPGRLPVGLEEPLARAGGGLGLPPEHPTLPSLLREAGYRTALIGKWHLGLPPAFGPQRSGYERFFGNLGGAIDYFSHRPGVGTERPRDLWEGSEPVERTGYYTALLGEEGAAHVRAQAGQGAPWLLSLHFTAPHWPWVGPEDEAVSRGLRDLFHYDGGNLAVYARMVEALDAAVGQVLDALADSGQAENTIVVFTSDNGGERFSQTWPFVGQKTELLEGGLRVPTLLRWPAALQAQVSTQVTVTLDWLPTLLAAAGLAPHPDYPSDGIDLLPWLRAAGRPQPRRLFWRYKAQNQRAVRDGDWKYLKINAHEFLFDLSQDTLERANLREREPAVFERLRADWAAWDATQLPVGPEVFSHGLTPDIQADRYAPERTHRLRP